MALGEDSGWLPFMACSAALRGMDDYHRRDDQLEAPEIRRLQLPAQWLTN
jgi:hypothetical protein